jgi:hypothetical protein
MNSKVSFIHEKSTEFSIIISNTSSQSQRNAAQILHEYIEKCTGILLTISEISDSDKVKILKKKIIIGDLSALAKIDPTISFESLGDDGFWFSFTDDHIIIAGSKVRGTIFGVFEFLERYLNVRFFEPNFTVTPKTTSVDLPRISENNVPDFEYRMITYINLLDPEFSITQKCNLNPFAEDEYGGSIRLSTAHLTHTFYQLVDPKKYYKEHPEYFALVDGKRIGNMGQLCLTNQDVQKIAAQSVLKWFKEDPRTMSMGVIQNDVNNYCECEKCRKFEEDHGGVHSAPIINLCNYIALTLDEVYPNIQKFVHTIAYTYSLIPPMNMFVHKRVLVVPCDMYPDCADHKPIGEDELTVNYLKYVKQWVRIADNVLVWHYAVDFVHYLLPFPNFKSLYENAKIYKSIGVKGILFQASTSLGAYGENEEFRNWFAYKILWKTALDYDTLIRDYIYGYYGKAADVMYEYFNELQNLASKPNVKMHLYSGLEAGYLEKNWVYKYQTKLTEALSFVENDEQIRKHIEKQLITLDYAYLLFPVEFDVSLGKIYAKDIEYRKKVFTQFKQLTTRYNIGTFGENVPANEFLNRQEILAKENSILAIAELAPTVLSIITTLLKKVESAADMDANFSSNDFIVSALKAGFHPIELNHWMNEKQIADWSPDVDIWTRKLNKTSIDHLLHPKPPFTKRSQLPGFIFDMINGIPHQFEDID